MRCLYDVVSGVQGIRAPGASEVGAETVGA